MRIKIQNTAKRQGFTLVELAVVLVLIGLVMTMGLKVVMSTLENASYSETKAKQELIKVALISFLRTNGRLPCPDVADAANLATGVAPASCSDSPAEGYGVVPWMSLGLPRDSVVDGWGNYFTYRVANGTGGSKNWTSKSANTPFDINELRVSTNALRILELDATGAAFTATPTSTTAVVIILSHGKNGFGAKTTKVGARLPTTDAGAGEITNATGTTTDFVLRPVNESAAAFNGAYDDLLTFMTPQMLFQPLLNEGTLKACAAYCASLVTATCSVIAQQCVCSTVGVPGVPGGAVPCTGTCGICSPPTFSNCTTTQPIPIGASPITCL